MTHTWKVWIIKTSSYDLYTTVQVSVGHKTMFALRNTGGPAFQGFRMYSTHIYGMCMWSILRIYSVVYNRSSSLCTSAMSHPSPLILTNFTDSFHSCNSNSIGYNCFYSTSHCRSYSSDHNGYLVREICSTHILASSLLLGDQILMRSIATKSTVMRSICHEINSHEINLPRNQLNFCRLKKNYFEYSK